MSLPTTSPIVAGGSLVARLAAGVLFLCLALGLVVPKIAGGGYLLLATISLVWLSLARAWTRPRWVRHEQVLVLVVALFIAVHVLAWAIHGFDPAGAAGLRRLLRLALIVPIYLFIRRADGMEPAWWGGLAAGAWIAGAYAVWVYLSGSFGEFEQRVAGPTNPIYFGGLALAFGLMLLPRAVDRDTPPRWRLWWTSAVLMALTASALAASRGAWPALLPLAFLYVFTLGSRERPWIRFGLPALVLAVIMTVATVSPLSGRIAEAGRQMLELARGQVPELSVGQRARMWHLAAERILARPLAGSGPGEFERVLEQAVAADALDENFLVFRHPHNQYLSAMLEAGLFGLLVLLALLLVPMAHYVRLWHSGIRGGRSLGWCGLAGVVVLATMMLTESIFERNAGVVWFGLVVAGSSGLIAARRRRELAENTYRRRHSLSVIVIAFNEADRIADCLESVHGWADEIIVLDSGSSDGTADICRRYTDKVEVTDWPGFGPQKQRATDRAGGDWVLSLDADERVSAELKAEVDLVLSRPQPHFHAYRLRWVTQVFGRTLQFGSWSRAPLRLFERGAARFTPAQVHEKVLLTLPGAAVGLLEGPLYHKVFRDLNHAREKLAGYAELQAGQRYQTGRRTGPLSPGLRAGFNFLHNFVLRGGFLDGRGGWIMSKLYARYTFDKYRLLRQGRRRAQ